MANTISNYTIPEQHVGVYLDIMGRLYESSLNETDQVKGIFNKMTQAVIEGIKQYIPLSKTWQDVNRPILQVRLLLKGPMLLQQYLYKVYLKKFRDIVRQNSVPMKKLRTTSPKRKIR